MPATPQPPYHRWGVRFTSDATHAKDFLQDAHDNDASSMYRGELFLNEALDEAYYVDSTGVVRILGERTNISIPFERIDFTGIREFATDFAASVANPPVPIGGLYRTESTLKIRVA